MLFTINRYKNPWLKMESYIIYIHPNYLHTNAKGVFIPIRSAGALEPFLPALSPVRLDSSFFFA